MQAEAGQGLGRIVRRKELERRAGDGLFFWGVGNAPPRAMPALARIGAEIDVVFSVMKSRPKPEDVAPSRVLAWRSYVDAGGVVRSVPRNVLVTSRAGSRDCHYALVCRSEVPLEIADLGPFDPAAYRNYGGGRPVGASQVTALLERCQSIEAGEYRIAMSARLVGGMWVKLIDPVEVTGTALAGLDDDVADEESWLELVTRVRSSARSAALPGSSAQHYLFAV
jgi:limonene-1,2-epoxide hydrolase